MKRFTFLLGILALALVFGLTLASCGGDGNNSTPGGNTSATYTGYDANGNAYTLGLTNNNQQGDTYVLTITSPTNAPLGTSTGTVYRVSGSGGNLELQRETVIFIVIISGGNISSIPNAIPLDGGGTRTAPGALTPNKPSGGNEPSGDDGTFTVTGIPSTYNGKYAGFEGVNNTVELLGCQSYNMATEVGTLVQIVGGSVSLPMWVYNSASNQLVRYTGNHTVEGAIGIWNSSTSTESEIVERGWASITFSNGSATRTWDSGTGGGNQPSGESPFGTSQIRAVAYGNNRFVAVGYNGKMATSTDGTTWTAVTDNTFGTSTIWDIAFGNGKFVAGGGSNLATSTDGATWTASTDSTFSSSNITVIAYGDGKFIGGGQTGKIVTSVDGVAWTTVSNSPFSTSYICAIANGNGRFVAVATANNSHGLVSTSTDGVTWTAASDSPFGASAGSQINGITYGSGKFVAMCYNPVRMSTSADGITWTAATDGTIGTTYNNSIVYGGNRFVAGGSSGKMAYSSDGVTWTAVANSPFATGEVRGIAYGSNRFVAVNSNGAIAYSSDGATWTAAFN